jgi:hypothetical protein
MVCKRRSYWLDQNQGTPACIAGAPLRCRAMQAAWSSEFCTDSIRIGVPSAKAGLKPADDMVSSGWHLHPSLVDAQGRNLFAPEEPSALLSTLGRHYFAGLLEGTCEATAFTTPTINGYKRYRALSLAPDRVAWGRDNRGTMLAWWVGRIRPRRASRIESASRPPIPISISTRSWPRAVVAQLGR